MQSDGSYERRVPADDEETCSVQETLMHRTRDESPRREERLYESERDDEFPETRE